MTVEALRKELVPGRPWDSCEGCAYDGGFHLVPALSAEPGAAKAVTVLLKCPSCQRVYDAGLVMTVSPGQARAGSGG